MPLIFVLDIHPANLQTGIQLVMPPSPTLPLALPLPSGFRLTDLPRAYLLMRNVLPGFTPCSLLGRALLGTLAACLLAAPVLAAGRTGTGLSQAMCFVPWAFR